MQPFHTSLKLISTKLPIIRLKIKAVVSFVFADYCYNMIIDNYYLD